MAWWQKMVFPVRRVWFAVTARVKTRKDGGGILKLHNDVQTCGYEDVQVMWEMLRRSEMELIGGDAAKCKKQRASLWRLLVPSRSSSACSPIVPHHHSNP